MQTLEQFRQLLEFEHWANDLIFASLKNSPQPAEKAVRAFAHLLLTEKVYLQRIHESVDNTGFDFWSGDDLAVCQSLIAENKHNFGKFFATLTEEKLDTTTTYKNSRGEQYTNTIREVLTHIFFHSVHHRGQVLTHIRAAGEEPPYVDFIGFLRSVPGT